MSNAATLTSADFGEKTASGVTLVDFWAEWCGPCRMLTPTIDDLAAAYAGKALIAKVNVDDCQDIAIRFSVNVIPTLVVLKDGAEVSRLQGVTPRSEIAKAIDAALGA